jgi:hypothetical protein
MDDKRSNLLLSGNKSLTENSMCGLESNSLRTRCSPWAVDATVVKCLGANRGRQSARGPNTLKASQMDYGLLLILESLDEELRESYMYVSNFWFFPNVLSKDLENCWVAPPRPWLVLGQSDLQLQSETGY